MASSATTMNGLTAPREVIGRTLGRLADQNPRLVVLDADLGRSTRTDAFEAVHPGRWLQLGVAEQNAVSVASGLSYAGYHPVFASMAMFSLALPWTQLRQSAYAGLSMTIIGTHPGLDVGPDGGTHQMLEDIALSRMIPELTVLSPCDGPETAAAIGWSIDHPGVTYIRIARQPVRDLHEDGSGFTVGRAEIVADHGRDLVMIAEGSMVSIADDVATALLADGIEAAVVNIRSIKPLDTELVTRLAAETDCIITLENHSVLGGLGSAVAESVGGRTRVERLGTPDRFGSSASADELRAHFGLDAIGIEKTVRALV